MRGVLVAEKTQFHAPAREKSSYDNGFVNDPEAQGARGAA
jgi:hypothetical protein